MEQSVHDEVRALMTRIGPLFARAESRVAAEQFILELTHGVAASGDGGRIGVAGAVGSSRVHRLLTTAKWDPDHVRNIVWQETAARFGSSDGVLLLQPHAFVKRGPWSAGVEHQWAANEGRTLNCQIAVFALVDFLSGACLADRRLYLPPRWDADELRRRGARIPDEVRACSIADLCCEIVDHAADLGVLGGWVASDDPQVAAPPLIRRLQQQEVPFVLRVEPHQVTRFARGTAAHDVEISSATPVVAAGESWRLYGRANPGGPRRTALLVRADPGDDRVRAAYLCAAPPDVPPHRLVQVAHRVSHGREWIEQAAIHVGLDQYEVRHWCSWHRYMTLVTAAHYCLNAALDLLVPGSTDPDGILLD